MAGLLKAKEKGPEWGPCLPPANRFYSRLLPIPMIANSDWNTLYKLR